MQRLFFAFPAGLPGAGLLLLRVAVAMQSVQDAQVFLLWMAMPLSVLVVLRVVSFLAVLCVLIGVATPIASLTLSLEAALALLLCSLRGAAPALHASLLLQLSVITMVLAAVGPGAFSLDARLFGRREIMLHD
ncbi:hypothetical protein [Acidipila sp. EB88]|uniref:hypothetical protein n=1 Tax=Acidipila sp. EB88 TaxID=2305226 RepID=UPI000F5D5DDA|nr:hypothetical protein [Acidipila sp. EB88]RRA50125.1 hypothetical protein D1Y84_11515 [Acidipila sp. EB88]